MDIPSTRTSLLSRLRDTKDQAAWKEFEANYRPLIVEYCRRSGLHTADAEDVAQQVMTGLSHSLATFLYDRERGRFRSYLLRCTKNAIIDWARCPSRRDLRLDTSAAGNLEAHNGQPSSEEETRWEHEWAAHHFRRALETLRQTFAPKSVELFERMLQGATASELAGEYQMTEEAVMKVRQRVRARMEELIGQQVREEEEWD